MAPVEVAGAVCGRPALLWPSFTFVVLTGLTPIRADTRVVVSFLLINGAIILVLVGIIIREVWQVVQARRRAGRRRRLHVQIVQSVFRHRRVPAVLVAIVANVTIDRASIACFQADARVIQNSLIVANAYLHEHAQLIRAIFWEWPTISPMPGHCSTRNRATFSELLTASAPRVPAGPMLIDKDRTFLRPRKPVFSRAHDAGAGIPEQCRRKRTSDRGVHRSELRRAVIRLRAFNDTFLYVARLLDPRVVAQLRQPRAQRRRICRDGIAPARY